MDKWQPISKCIGCPASGGCYNPFPWWIAFSTSLCLLLAWNCLAGREERNEEDLSFCLLNPHGWFGFGFVWVFLGLVFFLYDTKSFIQAAYILWVFVVFFFCVLKKATAWKGKTEVQVPVLFWFWCREWAVPLEKHFFQGSPCMHGEAVLEQGVLSQPDTFLNGLFVTLPQNYS